MKWNEVSALVRADVIEMSHRAKTAHLASALSCVDILTVLYTSIMEPKILFAPGTSSEIKSEWPILKSWYELPNLLQ